MLSAQKKPLTGKEAEASPYPKDFGRWYALDYFRRPGKFRTRRFWVTLATTAVFTLFTAATLLPSWHSAHQAAPLSTAHAMFNQQCSNCHTEAWAPLSRAFGCSQAASISDKTCNACHHGAEHLGARPHAQKLDSPACVSCHREHRGHEVLASHVPSRQCIACHGDLTSLLPGAKLGCVPTITSFNSDHPEFKKSKPEHRDASKIKFSHKVHLGLGLDDLKHREGLGQLPSKMECGQCHQLDAQRRYFLPIRYDQHCMGCHKLNVALAGDFSPELKAKALDFGKLPLPHKEPVAVRAELRERLVQFAQQHAVAAVKSEAPRPLPWKPATEVTEGQWQWTIRQAQQVEALLFVNKQWSKLEPLTWCSHCHTETKPGERVHGLPVYDKTEIPLRWHEQSVFSHGAHRMMECASCHDRNAARVKVADSKAATDVLLPTIQSCRECHRPAGSARNACVECHLYHDRTERVPGGGLGLEELLRKNR